MNLQRFFPLFEAEMKEHVLSNRERISKRLEIYKKIPAKDIQAPNPFKMKFLFPYYFSLTEKQVVNYLHILTISFCITGLFIF